MTWTTGGTSINEHAGERTTLHLDAGAILRLDRASTVSSLIVQCGAVWATTTPADEDIVLRTGDALRPGGREPVVIEALVPSDVLILRTTQMARIRPPTAGALWNLVAHANRMARRRMQRPTSSRDRQDTATR